MKFQNFELSNICFYWRFTEKPICMQNSQLGISFTKIKQQFYCNNGGPCDIDTGDGKPAAIPPSVNQTLNTSSDTNKNVTPPTTAGEVYDIPVSKYKISNNFVRRWLFFIYVVILTYYVLQDASYSFDLFDIKFCLQILVELIMSHSSIPHYCYVQKILIKGDRQWF